MALNRIMLVEDEPDIRTVAELALASVGGFEVKLCACGQEALDALPFYLPDLIMLDVMMPGMDGPATFTELRKLPAGKDVPVIFMTAKVQQAEVSGYKQLGAIGIIPKPFDPMTLAEKVRSLWIAGQ